MTSRQPSDLPAFTRLNDTFATLCSVLGIPIPKNVTGHVVDAAFGPAGKQAQAAGASGH